MTFEEYKQLQEHVRTATASVSVVAEHHVEREQGLRELVRKHEEEDYFGQKVRKERVTEPQNNKTNPNQDNPKKSKPPTPKKSTL